MTWFISINCVLVSVSLSAHFFISRYMRLKKKVLEDQMLSFHNSRLTRNCFAKWRYRHELKKEEILLTGIKECVLYPSKA